MRIFRADFGYHGGVGPEQRGQNAQLMKALMKADYKLPSDVSEPLVDLVSHLIQPDAAKRYSAAEALKHAWCLGPPGAADRTVDDIVKMEEAMSHAYIATPDGDDPEAWVEKIKGAGAGATAAPAPAPVDVDFDDGDEAGF